MDVGLLHCMRKDFKKLFRNHEFEDEEILFKPLKCQQVLEK